MERQFVVACAESMAFIYESHFDACDAFVDRQDDPTAYVIMPANEYHAEYGA